MHPTVQRSYPIPIGSASVDPSRPDNVVIEHTNGRYVSEQNVYRMPPPPLQQPPGQSSVVPQPLHFVGTTNASQYGYPNP